MITLQRVFNTGIYAFFGGYQKNKCSSNNLMQKHDEELIGLKKWINKNKLDQKYDIKYEEKCCPGIILGKFQTTGGFKFKFKYP